MSDFKKFENFGKYVRSLVFDVIAQGKFASQNDIHRSLGLSNSYISTVIKDSSRPSLVHFLKLSKLLTGDAHLLHQAWLYFNDRELFDLLEKENEENITKLVAQNLPELSKEKIDAIKEGLKKLQM